MSDFSDKIFPISLSVGTSCQAKCPYCQIPCLPQSIASGAQLIHTCEKIMHELQGLYKNFVIRITGGEIGLVPKLEDFINWLNAENKIKYSRIYTNGKLFYRRNIDLKKKCYVYNHQIHDVQDRKFIYYDSTNNILSLDELQYLIAERSTLCSRYRMVMVENAKLKDNQKLALKKIGIKFLSETGQTNQPLQANISQTNRFCFESRYLYVFDVAHKCFFYCCEVKNPEQGSKIDSIIEFLTQKPGEQYKECQTCKTCNDIKFHRNAFAINRLRKIFG